MKRTSISSDKMQVVEEPPIRIEGDETTLDPQKVISAWLASAEVLKEVAAAVRENQQDNDTIRQAIIRHRSWMFKLGLALSVLQVISVLAVFSVNYSAEGKIRTFVKGQSRVSREIRAEAAETRKEAALLRKEGKALSGAMAAVLDASLARDGGNEQVMEQKFLDAELSIAAVQVKVADTPLRKAKAEARTKEVIQKAKESQVSVDSEVLQGL